MTIWFLYLQTVCFCPTLKPSPRMVVEGLLKQQQLQFTDTDTQSQLISGIIASHLRATQKHIIFQPPPFPDVSNSASQPQCEGQAWRADYSVSVSLRPTADTEQCPVAPWLETDGTPLLHQRFWLHHAVKKEAVSIEVFRKGAFKKQNQQKNILH